MFPLAQTLGAARGTRGSLVIASLVVVGCTQGAASTTAPSNAAAPSAAVGAASPAATTLMMGDGTFHDVDGTASGEAQLVVKPDGSYEVVLEGFKIDAIAHTNLVLVSNADVKATGDIDKTKLLDLGPLKAAEGMQDFPIPADMASSVMDGYHTVVIWDTEMAHAIAAAPLS